MIQAPLTCVVRENSAVFVFLAYSQSPFTIFFRYGCYFAAKYRLKIDVVPKLLFSLVFKIALCFLN